MTHVLPEVQKPTRAVTRMALNVFIVEDHTLVRSGIRALLQAAPNLNIVGEASNGRDAVEQIQKIQPELVLMDVAMPELNGIDAARQIHSVLPSARIIMLSMHEDRQYVFESLKAGATGYVLKSAAFQDLICRHRNRHVQSQLHQPRSV